MLYQMQADHLSEGVIFSLVASHVALVTIDREPARNAVNAAVTDGLERAIRVTESMSDVWTVVLTGSGTRAFCAGADLKEVSAGGLRRLITDDVDLPGSCTPGAPSRGSPL